MGNVLPRDEMTFLCQGRKTTRLLHWYFNVTWVQVGGVRVVACVLEEKAPVLMWCPVKDPSLILSPLGVRLVWPFLVGGLSPFTADWHKWWVFSAWEETSCFFPPSPAEGFFVGLVDLD